MSPLEIAANAITAVSIWLAARNSVFTWPVGIIGCVLFGFVFFGAQLYADTTLQVFFVVTSALGWWQWLHPSKDQGDRERRVTSARARTLAWMVALAVLVAYAYGSWLHRFTDAYLPYLDSAVLALSVMAQLLLTQRKIATWPAWLAVNTLSVALFTSRGLVLTAVLYAFYWINAWYGWLRWRNEMTAQAAVGETRS